MKKILTVLFVMLLLAGAFSTQSCQKCATCSYTYQVAGQPLATYNYPQLCGNSEDIDDYERVCQNAAAVYGNTCTCIDD